MCIGDSITLGRNYAHRQTYLYKYVFDQTWQELKCIIPYVSKYKLFVHTWHFITFLTRILGNHTCTGDWITLGRN